ncbi:hypothetical protein C477_16705 [Haloterrigena salina JCM 13891]|uniref:UspA domain-containing protein n=1 Tax=Haloterrigena salina JCM 13891 TaxID=1227488 RepID=M0C0G4_9EURY|nr:universal stress protein [Haloterrigena salina]ELZ16153.1 hypothetical protein C477_16705 [Haloterrigena salina JCM 13891]
MSFVVPFDGSELSEAALVRAVEYGTALEEDVAAVSLVSERRRYAVEKGWIEAGEPYDVDAVVDRLRDRVLTLAPDATFECERIREYPPEAELAEHIERLVLEHDPSAVFFGSENVGRVVTPLTSVGARVAAETSYDVFIVRGTQPPKLDALDPHPEFYDDSRAD